MTAPEDTQPEPGEIRAFSTEPAEPVYTVPAAPEAPPEPPPARDTTVLTLACGDTVSTSVPCSSTHYCSEHGDQTVIAAAEIREEV